MPSDGPQKRKLVTTAAESSKSSTGRVILVTGTAGFVGFLEQFGLRLETKVRLDMAWRTHSCHVYHVTSGSLCFELGSEAFIVPSSSKSAGMECWGLTISIPTIQRLGAIKWNSFILEVRGSYVFRVAEFAGSHWYSQRFSFEKATETSAETPLQVGIKYDRAQALEEAGVYTFKADLNDRSTSGL